MAESPTSGTYVSQAGSSQPSLAALRVAYARADDFTRRVQAYSEKAGIPALNELRYSGHHLLAALDDAGALIQPSDLIKAINHADRACYEAAEAGILFALDSIARFKADYTLVGVGAIVPDYTAILVDAEAAKDRITEPRQVGPDRSYDHADLMAMFERLRKHSLCLEISRDELNKAVAKERREGRRFVVTTIVASAGVIITAVAALYAALHASPASSLPMRPVVIGKPVAKG